MASPEAVLLGARLDTDHAPVTNGWMPVCRRCGAYTESPLGSHHIPSDNRLARAAQWLAQSPARQRVSRKVVATSARHDGAQHNPPSTWLGPRPDNWSDGLDGTSGPVPSCSRG